MELVRPHLTAPPTPAPSTDAEWLRLADAAALAGGVSTRTVTRWIRVGLVRASRPTGGVVLVERASLVAMLAKVPRGV